MSAINKWKNIIETGNSTKLELIVHKDAIFYSPVVFTPQKGKKLVMKYLCAAISVFKNSKFRYTNEIVSKEQIYGEFTALLNGIEINGIDHIKIENNLIKEFKVFLRPLKGIEVVWLEMKKTLGS